MSLPFYSFALPPFSRKRQGGQALVFALFTSVLTILAMFTMYSMGGQTIDKIKLQNTADAAAYSVSVTEARDYNYSAYTTRAMIANQVAVAQFVGMTSYFRNLSTFANGDPTNWGRDIYQVFLTVNNSAPIPGIYKSALKSFGKATGFFDDGKTGTKFMAAAVTVLDGMIKIYSESQRVYHYSTALSVAQTLGVFSTFGSKLDGMLGISGFAAAGSLLEHNINPLSGDCGENILKCNDDKVRLTTAGFPYLALHFYNWFNFTEFKDPNTGGKDGTNADRFAKITMESLDGFSRDRSTKDTWMGSALPYLPPLSYIDPMMFIPKPWTFGGALMVQMHRGGTELKLIPKGTETKAKKAWVALDASSWFGLYIFWFGPIPPFLPFPIPIPIPMPPWIPLSHGAAQSGAVDKADSLKTNNNFGVSADDAFGSTVSDWTTASSAKLRQNGTKKAEKSLDLITSFGGLTNYMDVKDEKKDNLTGPTLIVEIEKTVSDVNIGKGVHGNRGQLETDNGAPNNDKAFGNNKGNMRSLSKSQVYFSRPTTDTVLTWFKRTDGSATQTEYGSLYNPYWQARLLPNNFLEQYLSMELHRKGF